MYFLKYITEIIMILVIYGSSLVHAETLNINCGVPSYLKWGEYSEKWEKPQNPIYREMIIQIDFDLYRSRVKYQNKWYSWAYSNTENDIIKWKYSKKFSYSYNLKKNELIEKQDELLFKYLNCRSVL
ncbi:MAG: hypothetical protein CMM49_01070 [Rhodospirillaceae bacterium]|nr:hypothetical protein [Rhodospirillaceae bacterium]|tara:strand:- start:16115 stop:16495 length:381 start_codon:yes stop_codon:yes gene_type:complete